MMKEIDDIIATQGDKCSDSLKKFVKNESQSFSFPELDKGHKRKDLWGALYHIAKTTQVKEHLKNCFIAIRILSREKQELSGLVTEEWLSLIKETSGLDQGQQMPDTAIATEAQKSLCNIVFNCQSIANRCCQNGILQSIKERIKKDDPNLPQEVKFFDMKLFFLLTALCPSERKELEEFQYILVKILEGILKDAAETHMHSDKLPTVFLSNDQIDMACEVLKTLFNITVHIDENNPELMANCYTLVEVLRNYLLISSTSLEKTWMLRNNIVNLLTNMPNETYESLLMKVEDESKVPKTLQFEGYNMTAIYEILMFLKAKFNDEPKVSSQHEVLSPVVSVLLKGANGNRSIRKFLRHHILPPLKDVHTRPEQGDKLRNHLCRLLTTPITQLRDLVAELLFVLCKKNVSRMIKYSGYGNAAGLFAQRGLLAGGRDEGEADFTSSDSDSETEEYAEYKHGINPVVGCYQEPHPSVADGMTDEQVSRFTKVASKIWFPTNLMGNSLNLSENLSVWIV
ncbi:unnamed protein product [Acanthoscelides obtectus]|uniref:Synembryn-A n=1 Tax=Acanthoscelides obtectus TaxID=200917 RepID=A0A9P0MFU6_ACAOB|nr:unnamed protein product [Acanthoscelides obtectus]CAK1659214.1 Synembryn-A [Acanthoscelides obtectus]